MSDIDTFKANWTKFQADFGQFATDQSAALARVQASLNAANSGNNPEIADAATSLGTLDAQLQQMDATIQGIDAPAAPAAAPTPAAPAAPSA